MNTGKDEISTIDKIFLLIKVMIDRGQIDVSIKILQILQQANIKQITANVRRPIIFWDIKTVINKQKAKNS